MFSKLIGFDRGQSETAMIILGIFALVVLIYILKMLREAGTIVGENAVVIKDNKKEVSVIGGSVNTAEKGAMISTDPDPGLANSEKENNQPTSVDDSQISNFETSSPIPSNVDDLILGAYISHKMSRKEKSSRIEKAEAIRQRTIYTRDPMKSNEKWSHIDQTTVNIRKLAKNLDILVYTLESTHKIRVQKIKLENTSVRLMNLVVDVELNREAEFHHEIEKHGILHTGIIKNELEMLHLGQETNFEGAFYKELSKSTENVDRFQIEKLGSVFYQTSSNAEMIHGIYNVLEVHNAVNLQSYCIERGEICR